MVERVGQHWPHLALHAAVGLAPAREGACSRDALDRGVRPFWNYLKRQNTLDIPPAPRASELQAPARAAKPPDHPASIPLASQRHEPARPKVPAAYAPTPHSGRLVDVVI